MKIETLELLIKSIKEDKIKDIDKMDVDSLIDMDNALSDFILTSEDEKRLSLYRVAEEYEKRGILEVQTLTVMKLIEQQDNSLFREQLTNFSVNMNVLNSQGVGYIIDMVRFLIILYDGHESILQISDNIDVLTNETLMKRRSICEIKDLLVLANLGYTSSNENKCRLRCLLSVVKNENLLNELNKTEHLDIVGIIAAEENIESVKKAVGIINFSDKSEYSVLKEKVQKSLITDIDTNNVDDLEKLLVMLKNNGTESFTTETSFITTSSSERGNYVKIKGRPKKSND